MHETTHFFNLGYGWLCKHCTAEDAERKQQKQHQNGERKPVTLALARWIDAERHGLTCPRCGIQELVTRI